LSNIRDHTVTLEKVSKSRRTRSLDLSPEKDLEEMFEDALELLDIFESSTRRKMLLLMYRGPCNKSYLRSHINPKLVYENLEMLREREIIEEVSEGTFDLTEIGKRLLREYLQFLQSLRRTIWEM
jgi:predicted transcriptional regulator